MSVRAYRAAMLSGVAFALLLFFGTGQMFGPTPDTSGKTADVVQQKWADFVADSGHRTGVIVGGFMMTLAAIALIWFASAIRERLAPGAGPMFGFAVLAATGVALSAAGPLAVTAGHTFGNDPVPTDGNTVWLVFSVAFPALLVTFGLAIAAFIATILVTGRGVLPMWLIIFGWLAVLGAIFAVEFIPAALVILWFLAFGIYGAVRPGMGTASPTTTTAT